MTQPRERAHYFQARYAQDVKDIRADSHLSGEGKRRALAQAYLRTREELQQLQKKESEAVAKRRRELERSLFGLSAGRGDAAMLSLRDAQQRAAGLKAPAQALTLLATAERSGDDILARAVAAHAWDRGWTRVLDAYAAERPGVLEKFHELDSLDGGQGVDSRLVTEMAFRLPVPPDLRGAHTEAALRELAAG